MTSFYKIISISEIGNQNLAFPPIPSGFIDNLMVGNKAQAQTISLHKTEKILFKSLTYLNILATFASVSEPTIFDWKISSSYIYIHAMYMTINLFVSKLIGTISECPERKNADLELTRDFINLIYTQQQPFIILIPAYKEPKHVLARSLLSSLFQNYPNRVIVLLIDDPEGQQEESIAVILSVNRRLNVLKDQIRLSDDRATLVQSSKQFVSSLLAWLKFIDRSPSQQSIYSYLKQVEVFFDRLDSLPSGPWNKFVVDIIRKFFQVQLHFFCRKKFIDLPQEKTKAANINTFIDCLKNQILFQHENGEILLEGSTPFYPLPQHIGIIDADTTVHPDWAMSLIFLLQKSTSAAIAQSLYCYEGEKNIVQMVTRMDIHLSNFIFSGMNQRLSAPWIGTNSVFKTEKFLDYEKFVSDRTVIEDLETSIRAWNHEEFVITAPSILAFSMGPQDLGGYI